MISESKEEEKEIHGEDEVLEPPKPKEIKPYVPPIPFPQRLKQHQYNKEFGKFFDMLKKLNINIPFVDAIAQMPNYAKFLKSILTNKRKLEDFETVTLNEECSAILQNKLPPKLKIQGVSPFLALLEIIILIKLYVIWEQVLT
ncbi:hypothetical protein SLEP1_g45943 [Rubroshorea leprosula]|uniref:Reverse transcriptase domain-containing protein n=1 Tax=Rubroshorea leprosula TaxID=152421 RepID=A0AAV5LKM6_9ROSI|nr:hypothetical protein SLEP1_g45943 [Rubroshorea leprosula]